MPISQKMQDALNEQIKVEKYSSWVYLSMSAWCDSQNLPGFANWMRIQAQEEDLHSMKFFDHILDRGGQVKLGTINQPPHTFESPIAVFENALHHERFVTKSIHDLYALSLEEKDFAAKVMLDWFVTEQVEEEKNAELVVERLKMIGDDRVGLLQLDRELAARQPEAAEAGAGKE